MNRATHKGNIADKTLPCWMAICMRSAFKENHGQMPYPCIEDSVHKLACGCLTFRVSLLDSLMGNLITTLLFLLGLHACSLAGGNVDRQTLIYKFHGKTQCQAACQGTQGLHDIQENEADAATSQSAEKASQTLSVTALYWIWLYASKKLHKATSSLDFQIRCKQQCRHIRRYIRHPHHAIQQLNVSFSHR